MIARTRKDLLTAMHSEAFSYALHRLFAKLARTNGHREAAELLEEIATAEYLEPFAEDAKLVGFLGTDVENFESIMSETHAPRRRRALEAALAELRDEAGTAKRGAAAPTHSGLPEADQDEVC
jgi:hypothetical protein